jgi:hypothetical protein
MGQLLMGCSTYSLNPAGPATMWRGSLLPFALIYSASNKDTTDMRAALRRHLAMLGVERQALGPTYAPDDWLSSGRTGTGRTPTR